MRTSQRFIAFAAFTMLAVIAAFILITQRVTLYWQGINHNATEAVQVKQINQLFEQFEIAAQRDALYYQVNKVWPNDSISRRGQSSYHLPINFRLMLDAKANLIDSQFAFTDLALSQAIISDHKNAFLANIQTLIHIHQQHAINDRINLMGLAQVAQIPALIAIDSNVNQSQFFIAVTLFEPKILKQINQDLVSELTIDFVDTEQLATPALAYQLKSTVPYLNAAQDPSQPPHFMYLSLLSDKVVKLSFSNTLNTHNTVISAVSNAIEEAQQEYKYVMIILMFCLLVFFALIYTLRKNYISPLSQLVREVSLISPFKSELKAIQLAKDAKPGEEIKKLAQTINDMLTELFNAKEIKKVTLNSIGDAVITTDLKGRITYLNQAAISLINVNNNAYLDMHVAEILPFCDPDDVNKLKEILDEVLCQGNEVNLSRVTHKLKRELDTLYVEKHLTLLRDQNDHVMGSVMVLRDMTQSEKLRNKLNFQASYDAVTKLLNRHKYEEILNDAFFTAKEQHRQHVLCQLDLDRFKLINDSAGHAAGDQLLYEMGTLLKTYIRKIDNCARIGGDEFAIILYDTSIDDSLLLFNKLVSQIKQYRFIWGGRIYSIGASFGITAINHHAVGIPEIRREADAACYMAKSVGQNNIRVFDSTNENLNSHHQAPRWASRINDALVNDKFQFFFQRITPTGDANQAREHIEILLRLEDENQGLLSPAVFLPAAERFRLMVKIDRWVIKHVFRWLMARPELWQEVTLCINLSGESLTDSELYDYIISLHSRVAFPPEAICFEVTETAAVANLVVARTLIEKLRSHGFTFALDDFGKGFSSYSYLQNLPAEYVKIDGNFVRKMTSNKSDHEIVRSIHDISNVMGMKTIAEYVEDEETLIALRKLGVDFAQGFGIEKPTSIANFKLKEALNAVH